MDFQELIDGLIPQIKEQINSMDFKDRFEIWCKLIVGATESLGLEIHTGNWKDIEGYGGRVWNGLIVHDKNGKESEIVEFLQ